MQSVLTTLKSLKTELEITTTSSPFEWHRIEIWGTKALPTIAKHYPEYTDEFKQLLKRPVNDSEGHNEQQNRYTADPLWDIYAVSREKLLALLSGLLNEAESIVSEQIAAADVSAYVNLERINELRAITSEDFDVSKLVRMCEELNICFTNGAYFSTLMLVRAILDHVPPIFELRFFREVSNNYKGTQSFKRAMDRLEKSTRNIADGFLHERIRDNEVLPNQTQVTFDSELDVLLSEIYRKLK